MATTPGVLPTSNVGGNNQTSPGLSATPAANPVFTPMQGAGAVPSTNPYLSASPTSTPISGALPGTGALYNTATSPGYGGQTNISKQLTDILGKGVGGSLNNILSNLSGTDSAIFQQWLASQVPAQAQAEASMRQGLGAMGVSGNSSVAGLAEANLGANFNAQAAAENANLMQQAIGTSTNILQGVQSEAAQQVATSPWSIASQVIGEAGSVAGDIFGGGGGIGSLLSKGTSGIMSNFAAPVLSQLAGSSDPINPTSFMGQLGQSAPNVSALPWGNI